MGKKIIYSIFLIMITFALKAEGYLVSVKWEGLSDTTIYLAHYYESSIFVDDTLKLNKQGEGEFSGDSLLRQGLYMLYLNRDSHLDFLLGKDQTLAIETDQSDLMGKLSIKGASESQAFLDYQKFLKEKMTIKNKLLAELKDKDKDSTQTIRDELNKTDKQMAAYLKTETEKAGNSMYGLFLRTANMVDVPEPDVDKSNPKYDSTAWFHSYNYQRDHFFDNVDFTDDRILNTPLLNPKLDTYFNKILIQSPDSIIPQAMKLLKRAEPNRYVYQYLTQFLINNSTQSKIMGMDAVFVAIADSVYLKGKATWADSTILAKIAEEAYLTRPNLIGKKAPPLVMQNLDGEIESLDQLQCDYTILVFYEYDCGHCKKDIPILYNDVFLKFMDDNIDAFAVCMNNDKEKWNEFVTENELVGWHNVWDPNHTTLFRYKYNVKTTPTIYLLDKDKKIIAKRIDNSSLTKLLNVLLNKK